MCLLLVKLLLPLLLLLHSYQLQPSSYVLLPFDSDRHTHYSLALSNSIFSMKCRECKYNVHPNTNIKTSIAQMALSAKWKICNPENIVQKSSAKRK